MACYELADLGGRFLTTGRRLCGEKTYPEVSAFVQYFIPENPKDLSVTFVHGGGGQGNEFLSTSDGRPGWAQIFLQRGYPVYILDRPGHGRAVWNDHVLGPSLPPPDYESLYPRFVDVSSAPAWPGAEKHSRWPQDPLAGDRFMASQGPMATSLEASQRHVEAIAPELFAMTGRTILVTHSAGGPCGWALAAMGGDAVETILAIEPLGHPGLEHALGTFRDGLVVAPLAGGCVPFDRPIAIVTGEATWMQEQNAKAAMFLLDKGYPVEHIRLEERGITGNGHMMMSETNSDEIAKLLIDWLENTL